MQSGLLSRIAFASLVERGLVKAGETVTDAKGKVRAVVRPDGSLTLKSDIGKMKGAPVVGSIHKIGAIAQGLEACKSIDTLRAVVRSEMASV